MRAAKESPEGASITAKVRAQYERFPYPKPIEEISEALLSGADGLEGCPYRDFHLYWPTSPYREDLDILVAGCGSSQAAVVAATLPKARVVGIDISAESIARSEALARRHGILNVEHRLLSIYDVQKLGRDFDLIQAVGMLHHLPDPVGGLRSLRSMLRRQGSVFIMLYGRYGRDGVYILQDLFRRLAVSADNVTSAELEIVRNLIPELPESHPIHFRRSQMLFTQADDAELVDLFLHPRDVSYNVPEVFALLREAGFKFQRWYNNAEYNPRFTALVGSPFYARIEALPLEERFAIGELARAGASRHSIIACRDDRPSETALPDWQGELFWNAIPFVRWLVNKASRPDGAPGVQLTVNGHSLSQLKFNLDRTQTLVLQAIDGRRRLDEIAQDFRDAGSPEAVRAFIESFVRDMVDADVLALRAG